MEQLTSYYSGDHLLIQGESNNDSCMVNNRDINDHKNISSNDDSMNGYIENDDLNMNDGGDLNSDKM